MYASRAGTTGPTTTVPRSSIAAAVVICERLGRRLRRPRSVADLQDDDAPLGLLADRLRRHTGNALEREVDPATLERRHRLELEHRARCDDALGGPMRELRELTLAAAAIVLDVDEDACPGAHSPRQHQVDEVLQGGKPLTLAADQRAQRLAFLVVRAGDVDLGRLAGVDGHVGVVAHQPDELLEDLL